MFDAYGKDPRVDTDAEVTVAEGAPPILALGPVERCESISQPWMAPLSGGQ